MNLTVTTTRGLARRSDREIRDLLPLTTGCPCRVLFRPESRMEASLSACSREDLRPDSVDLGEHFILPQVANLVASGLPSDAGDALDRASSAGEPVEKLLALHRRIYDEEIEYRKTRRLVRVLLPSELKPNGRLIPSRIPIAVGYPVCYSPRLPDAVVQAVCFL